MCTGSLSAVVQLYQARPKFTTMARAVTVSFLEHGIAVLRMQRGENRINPEFVRAFNDCLDSVESTPTCKGVITTGEGKFYCNGLDTNWMDRDENADAVGPFLKSFQGLLARILTFPVPTLASINGHCYAGGALIAYAHDIRVMNSRRGWICLNEVFIHRRLSRFNVSFLRCKITPGPTLSHAVVLGKKYTATEAEAAGLVDKSVPPVILEQESQRVLQTWIGKNGYPRESLQDMKQDVYSDALKELNVPRL